MWRVLVWLMAIGLIILGAGWYERHYPHMKYNQLGDFIWHPFDTRVRYRIGNIDPRFGLSVSQVRTLTEEAAHIWQEGTGQAWFVYDDKARLSINLVYDERQANTQKRNHLRAQVDDMMVAQAEQSGRLDNERAQLNAEFAALQAQINAWQTNHERIVNLINETRVVEDYQRLQRAYQDSLLLKRQLDERIEYYHDKQARHNHLVDAYNHQSDNINRTIDAVNSTITGEPFHKGVFDGQQIIIYEFDSIHDLRLTLAHELGHALDIGHHNEPTALMYPMMGEQVLEGFKLQPADIKLLNEHHHR